MKRIKVGKGVEIETPWLTGDEAWKYCGMGRNTFLELARQTQLPCTPGKVAARKYHARVLDCWMMDAPWRAGK